MHFSALMFVVRDKLQEKVLKNLFHLDNMVTPFISWKNLTILWLISLINVSVLGKYFWLDFVSYCPNILYSIKI